MKGKKKRWAVVASVLLLAAAAITGYYLLANRTDDENIPTTVRLREYSVAIGDLTAGIDAAGLLQTQRVPHYFDDPVTIGALFVQVGDTVHKGDKIAEISLSGLEEKVASLQNRSLRNKLLAIVKDYKKKKQALTEAKEAKILYEMNAATTKKPPEPAEKESKISALDQKIAEAQAAFEKADEAIQRCKELLPGTTLYAQTDGIVLSVDQKVGDQTSEQTPVVTIGELDTMTATLWVEQEDIGDIKAGEAVECEVPAFQDTKIMGTVLSRDSIPDANDTEGRYKVKVSLSSGSLELFEGMTCNATFIIKQVKGVLTLSNKAIQLKDGKQFVKMKNADGTLREIEIVTGFSDGRSSEIISGLKSGDVVVIEG